MKIISRAEARSQGSSRYFTGKPCRHNHIAERLVSNGHCCDCKKLECRTWRSQNAELIHTYHNDWRRANLELGRAYAAKRRAAKLKATPKWADLEKINLFYQTCPKGFQVDHIIPLQGEIVSGLHVLENLQYLTVKANRKKSNSWEF